MLVLDECHHLLEVWGRLLAELLDAVDRAHVLALTATPPESLAGEQRALVDQLFGSILYRVSVPAVVKEGHLAPFDELVWLTTPTPTEEDWLTSEALRFTELTTLLTTPGFGSVGFYEWLTARFVEPVPATTTWAALAEREPDLCDAALRMHHAGLLDLPVGARLREEHRHAPSAEDWVRLLGDWLLNHVAESDDPGDAEVLAVVKAALPSVGYQWTRRGVRRGRSTVDRVLARSYAKPGAAAQIIAAEHAAIGDRARVLVLCDHERASATVPVALDGVLDAEAGSAIAALEALLTDPSTAVLHPMLVTGSVVAASEATLRDLVAFVAGRDPDLASRLSVEVGRWTDRDLHVRVDLAHLGRPRHRVPRGRSDPGPRRHPRPPRRGVERPRRLHAHRPHHRHHPDGRRPDAGPGAAHRPDLAGQGRHQLDGRVRLGGAPQGRQRLVPAGAQAPGFPRHRRRRRHRRRGRPHRRVLLPLRPAARRLVRRPERPHAHRCRRPRRHP